jgi:hypothetical protein
MKKLLIVLASLLLSTLVFAQPSTDGITTCTGEYALCAASTCKPTGKTITGSQVPTFNSLTLFHLPDQNGKWHYVSHINPGVKSNRIAYTGWFKK